jgi:peptide/nickel transport system permease protein
MRLDYVLRRLGLFLLVVVVAVTINFFVPRLTPGDPVIQRLESMSASGTSAGGDFEALAKAYEKKFGYDQPLHVQYVRYWQDLLRGDFGYSIAHYPAKSIDIIGRAIPWTMGLLGVSTILAFAIGTLLGALLGWSKTPKIVQRGVIPFAIVFSSIPYYLLGILALFVFSLTFGLFPSGGAYGMFTTFGFNLSFITDVIHHATLPAASIIVASIGSWALGMRGMIITTRGEDYMMLAEAKGLRSSRIFSYAIRNAFLPQATAFALVFGHVVSGAVLVEVIFRYPGLGLVLFEAISGKDYFVVQGVLLVLILSIAFALFLIDLIYPLLDPRVSYDPAR